MAVAGERMSQTSARSLQSLFPLGKLAGSLYPFGTLAGIKSLYPPYEASGAGIAQWLERRTRD